jgi:hypothetical protein
MERRVRRETADDDFASAPELSLVDDVLPHREAESTAAPRRHLPYGPKPGKETPGGWRR